MLNLTSSQSVRCITASAGDIAVHYSYVDINSSTFAVSGVGSDVLTNISTATTTTIVPSPSAGSVRNVKSITIDNNHATTSNYLTIDIYDGADEADTWQGTLLPQERVIFDECGQWTVYGADGILKPNTLANFQQLPSQTAFLAVSDADTLKIYAEKNGGVSIPKIIGQVGLPKDLQLELATNNTSFYLPNNSTTVGLNYGIAWTSGGTVSHPTPSSTSPAIYNQDKRTRWANVATTTNQVLGLRTATAEKLYWRGNAAGLGGFIFKARFAVALWAAATVRLFVGLNDSNTGWIVSDTLTGNGCGFWHDTTDAASVLSFVTRDGTTATKAAITLASNLAAGQAFECLIYSAPNGSSIGYYLRELNTGTVLANTTTSTTLPLNTAFLGQELAMSNGTANTTVTTVAFELAGHSCQTWR